MDWTLPNEGQAPPTTASLVWRLLQRFTDWEDWLTLLLTLAATVTVSASLESGGWSQHMPPITLVSVLAVLGALLIAQTRLTAWLAWPLAVLVAALVTFWQTLEMVGPGNLGQRVDAIYFRFSDWFHLATSGGVSNDSLPFDVIVLGLTWIGVFIFGWSVYRWHNAWIGLIPGGIALFVDLVFVGDSLSGAVLLYLLFGFLLVMRTNLMARLMQWRADKTTYPSMISLTFLNFSAWALMVLLAAAWVAPVGPFSTPPGVGLLSRGVEEIGLNFVRLAGPLEVKQIVPAHDYTSVLPFQGTVHLGDREVLSVSVSDASVQGSLPLRGAVYDVYTSGGWRAGDRRDYSAPPAKERLEAALKDGSVSGEVIPLDITVERKSVVGTVLFSPGEPVAASVKFDIEVPVGAVRDQSLRLRDGGVGLSDEELLTKVVPEQLGEQVTGLKVNRDDQRLVTSVEVFYGAGAGLLDTLVAKPPERLDEGTSYTISGFIPTVTPDELHGVSGDYPPWVLAQYLQLPDTLPQRVRDLAFDVAGDLAFDAGDRSTVSRSNKFPSAGFNRTCLSTAVGLRCSRMPYEAAKAIEDYLRAYPLDYHVSDAPPGADAVDYFLFESRRGYFDYHASAMVVMLRALGIPARLAVGYVLDDSDFDAERSVYAVRDRNSYSWAEVYFPDHGWIAFNPSPDRAADLTPTITVGKTPSAADPTPVDSAPVLPLNDDPIGGNQPPPGADSGIVPATGRDKYNPLLTAGVFAFVALLASAAALGWQRSVAALPYSQQLWEKTVRLATWGGHAPQPGQTPTEFGRHLERAFHGAKGFSLLASVYNRSRFGKRDTEGAERDRLCEMWPDLRGDLLAAIPRRFLKRRRRQG